MVFSVIQIPPGLSAADHAKAAAAAPEFVATVESYPHMLAATGWAIGARQDLTVAFLASCRAKLAAEERLRDELVPLMASATDFDARQDQMRRRIRALERGQMIRDLFVVAPV
jgi:hypothetical protein